MKDLRSVAGDEGIWEFMGSIVSTGFSMPSDVARPLFSRTDLKSLTHEDTHT
jgi:hypothetical protein